MRWFVLGVVALLALAASAQSPPSPSGYVGWGGSTRGGEGRPIVRVTTLAGSGPGSLLEAVSGGNRTIVFDVAGEITPSDFLRIGGANVTIDGDSAPPPGITIRTRGFILRGDLGAHDIIIRAVRIRGALLDAVQIWQGPKASAPQPYNVVVDRVSVYDSHDGNMDITTARNVTVSNSILACGPEAKARRHDFNSLVKYGTERVTYFRNLLINCTERNPQVRWNSDAEVGDTTMDFRNNVVLFDGHGIYSREDDVDCPRCPRVNIVGNYFKANRAERADGRRKAPADHAMLIDRRTRTYVAGNVSGDGAQFLRPGNWPDPHPSPDVGTRPACEAARDLLPLVGAPHRDEIDQALAAQVTLVGCP